MKNEEEDEEEWVERRPVLVVTQCDNQKKETQFRWELWFINC
jgi:hypothetical protein